MSVAEAPLKPIFGQIKVGELRANEELVRAVLPVIQEACRHSLGRFTYESVFDGLIAGKFNLWGVLKPPADLSSVMVTRIEALDGERALAIVLLGPGLDQRAAFKFLPILEREARAHKCSRVWLNGPRIWQRELPGGWRTAACVFEKRIAG